jgi:hypothetical protein
MTPFLQELKKKFESNEDGEAEDEGEGGGKDEPPNKPREGGKGPGKKS